MSLDGKYYIKEVKPIENNKFEMVIGFDGMEDSVYSLNEEIAKSILRLNDIKGLEFVKFPSHKGTFYGDVYIIGKKECYITDFMSHNFSVVTIRSEQKTYLFYGLKHDRISYILEQRDFYKIDPFHPVYTDSD